VTADRATDLFISRAHLRLVPRIDQESSARVDVLAPRGEVFYLDGAALVGIDEPLELSIAAIDLTRDAFDVCPQCLASRRLFKCSVARDPLGIGHHLAKVAPDDLVEHLGLHRLQAATRLRIAIAVVLRVFHADVVAKDLTLGSARLRPCRDD
jgi:hypothetical protein